MTPARVLVVGLPRGGTTWIGRALGSCDGAVYVHEPDGVHDEFAYRAIVRDGLEHHPDLRPGDGAPEYERLWGGVFAGGARAAGLRGRVARRAFASVDGAKRARARRAGTFPWPLRVALRTASPRRAAPRAAAVVAKSVNAALAVEWIHDRFDPRVVVVRRDVRNVVASWLSIGFGAPGPGFYAALRRVARERWGVTLDDVDDPFGARVALIGVLTHALDRAADAHPEWIVLSHEAACMAPEALISAAAMHAGLGWDAAAAEFVGASNRPGEGYSTNRVSSEIPDEWTRRLSPEQVARVDEVLGRFPDVAHPRRTAR